MQTGLGRTGRMFAAEHWGLEPDLLTVAKALSGGYVPVGALLLRSSVHEAVFDTLEHSTSHGSTFAPNDLAMAAGLATLHELEARDLVARSARLGELLLERTRPLVERFDVVREVRGLGLMWAIEFGEPAGGSRAWRLIDGRQPGLFAQFVIGPLFREHHVLSQVAGHGLNVLKGLPPLVVARGGRDVVRGRARGRARRRAPHLAGRARLRRAGRRPALTERFLLCFFELLPAAAARRPRALLHALGQPPLLAVRRLGHRALLLHRLHVGAALRRGELRERLLRLRGSGFGPARLSFRIALASSGFCRSSAAWLMRSNQRRMNGIFASVVTIGRR